MSGHLLRMTHQENGERNVSEPDHYANKSFLGTHNVWKKLKNKCPDMTNGIDLRIPPHLSCLLVLPDHKLSFMILNSFLYQSIYGDRSESHPSREFGCFVIHFWILVVSYLRHCIRWYSFTALWGYSAFCSNREQTWNLSKILHRRIFRLKIYTVNFT